MPSSNANLNVIQGRILNLEKLLFSTRKPVEIEKLIPDGEVYDIRYEAKIRNKDSILICLLDECMDLFGRQSYYYRAINEIEACLMSPQFYRDMIFTEKRKDCEFKIDKLEIYLESDMAFLKENLSPAQYNNVKNSVSSRGLPKGKKEFLKELGKIKATLAEVGII